MIFINFAFALELSKLQPLSSGLTYLGFILPEDIIISDNVENGVSNVLGVDNKADCPGEGLLIVKIVLINVCDSCSWELLEILGPNLARIPSQLLFEGFSLFFFRELLIFEQNFLGVDVSLVDFHLVIDLLHEHHFPLGDSSVTIDGQFSWR